MSCLWSSGTREFFHVSPLPLDKRGKSALPTLRASVCCTWAQDWHSGSEAQGAGAGRAWLRSLTKVLDRDGAEPVVRVAGFAQLHRSGIRGSSGEWSGGLGPNSGGEE